ncbi:YadA family autotransporter adhesin [Cupriavidus numazuensis]|uniref:YadA family autotransporter adhesin n=1 Tax=Cupriavidus numazuensis TaxID=221992 RepID=UPI001BAD0252|nr:YadA-like family protein [Cupriavidus numazuensis]
MSQVSKGLVAVSTLAFGMGEANAVVVISNDQYSKGGTVCSTLEPGLTSIDAAGGNDCIVPEAGPGPSGAGNPGANIVMYLNKQSNVGVDSLSIGGYLDVWKTATFFEGVNMQGTRVSMLGAGIADQDAVNVGQFKGGLAALGGGAGVAADGSVIAPTYTLGGGTFNDVGSALSNLDGRITSMGQQGGGGAAENAYFHADGKQDGSDAAVVAAGTLGVAAGAGAQAQASNSVAIGANAQAKASDSAALGANAQATAQGSVALGTNSVADRANSVSVGAAGAERQITNVAAATQDTDAVNLGQLRDYASEAGRRAVSQANSYTDQRVDALSREAHAGTAAAMAMAGLPQSTVPGKSMIALGGATYRGQSGLAIGASLMSAGGRWVYKLTGSTARSTYGASVAAGFHW